jgi:hypothetical protein
MREPCGSASAGADSPGHEWGGSRGSDALGRAATTAGMALIVEVAVMITPVLSASPGVSGLGEQRRRGAAESVMSLREKFARNMWIGSALARTSCRGARRADIGWISVHRMDRYRRCFAPVGTPSCSRELVTWSRLSSVASVGTASQDPCSLSSFASRHRRSRVVL